MIALALLGACKGSEPPPVEPGLVHLWDDRVVVRTDTVGHDKWERRATFVLIDAENISDRDLLVTLTGTLTDADGKRVGNLRPESLWVPRGGERMFVMVDDHDGEQPTAVGADVVVRGAVEPRWKSAVRITDGHVFDDHGATQIAASLVNTVDRRGTVIVFAGFHDQAGKPMARQFQTVDMLPGQTQTIRFQGPQGSKNAYLFLGDESY